MHIHPNNNLQLAAIGAGREQMDEIQAKRAAEVRKRLSAASRAISPGEDEFSSTSGRVAARRSGSEAESGPGAYPGQPPGAEDASGRLFSAKA